MVIEFIGVPGAGKTTLLPTVIETLQQRGIHGRTVVEAARPYAQRTLPGAVAGRLAPVRWRRPLLWQLTYQLSTLYRLKFLVKHPQLARQVLARQKQRPPAALARQRRVLHWFFHTAGFYEFLTGRARPGEALLFDEGFIHRVVQLFVSDAEEPDPVAICAYVDLLPRPDWLIFIHAAPRVCQERIYRRGLWEHFRDKRPAEVARFVSNATCAVGVAVSQARRRGWTVIEVDNGREDLPAVQAELRHKLCAANLPHSFPLINV